MTADLVPLPPGDLDAATDPVGVVLAWCEQGQQALAAARDLAEGRDVLGAASVLEHAVRVRDLNAEAMIAASTLRIRAERRVGELIRAEREAGRLAEQGANRHTLRPVDVGQADVLPPATLADHGISRDQASEFQQLADADEEDFEDALAAAEVEARDKQQNVTRSAVRRQLGQEKPSPDRQWLDTDKFFEACGRIGKWDIEQVVTAIRFGVYPGDMPLVREAPRLLLDKAREVLDQVDRELRKKGL